MSLEVADKLTDAKMPEDAVPAIEEIEENRKPFEDAMKVLCECVCSVSTLVLVLSGLFFSNRGGYLARGTWSTGTMP